MWYYKNKRDKEEEQETSDVRGLVPQTPEVVKAVWRPTIAEANLAVIEAALKMDCTIDEACALAWVSRAVYYKYQKSYRWFRERMQKAADYPKVLARAAVQNQIAKWDWKLALKYLQLRDKRLKENWAVQDEWEQVSTPVVQFISVAPNKWQGNTTNPDSQTSTKLESVWDTSVTILENNETERKTDGIWENEGEILERLSWLSSNNE